MELGTPPPSKLVNSHLAGWIWYDVVLPDKFRLRKLVANEELKPLNTPRSSMYGIFTYIWVIYEVNVGKYSIHGAYGYIYIHNPMIVPVN